MAKKAATKTETKVSPSKTEKKAAEKVTAPVDSVEVPSLSNELVSDLEVQSCNYESVVKKLNSVLADVRAALSDVKTLQKQHAKDMKAVLKTSGKRKSKTDGNKNPKAPSGFVKPTLITDELAKFLGKPAGTEMARTEVTREINTYIREHKLQDKENGRKILADNALSTLLRLGKNDELTYFNLQKYMSCHFAKGGVLPTTTTA